GRGGAGLAIAVLAIAAILPVGARRTGFARFAVLPVLASVALRALAGRFAAVVAVGLVTLARRLAAGIVLALILVAIIVTALAALLLEAGAIFVEDAEIMIRILQIIFGLDPIALHLRVAGEALIFLEQLRRIAALTVVLAIARTRI